VVKHGVILVGQPNLAALLPTDASALYARNLLDFMKLIVTKEGALSIPTDDDIVTATLVTKDGAVLRA
jgi:NAD(P) transhydrogenase subunit alpha